ncbi:MAG: relaxase/mobilization nuclease domain-containing protein [Alphaproteobacteria bacterium]|nr:relaxase/mobilization nuclease domain-containing protein [Alphaproteobacteria bacterium]
MLAKVAPPSNDFHALARYFVHGKPGTTPSPKRVAWVLAQNLPTDDPELAATIMTATAELSPRTRKAAYHLMISWHQNQKPSSEAMQTIALETLKRAGLADHQALIMGHGDTPHRHLHMLINRVSPLTAKTWKTSNDYARLDRIMRELSDEHGFAYVPAHTYNPDVTDEALKKPNTPATHAAKRGAPTERPQWSKKASREYGEKITETLDQGASLYDVLAMFEEDGFQLEQKGQGYVVGDTTSYTKLSSLGLTFSANGLARKRQSAKPAFRKSVKPHRREPVFTVDTVDITRAMIAMGFLESSALREAVVEQQRLRDEQGSRTQFLKRLLGTSNQGSRASTALSARGTVAFLQRCRSKREDHNHLNR